LLALDESRFVRPLAESDLDELWALVDGNRAYLTPWMPWAEHAVPAETAAFLRASVVQAARNDGFHAAIVQNGAIVGVAGFHYVNRVDRATSLGYWLAEHAQGRGTMTLAVAALVSHAFRELGVHRVEIRAAVDNARSRAIPERLGFTQEGVLRAAQRFGDRYVDLVVYSVLAPEWRD
jgi:ribosomal-protein-serine acetyltransferase